MLDECHLLWGDILGYVWDRTERRIEIPIKNPKERQTYYGALDYQTQEFIIKGYSAGNTENTLNFLEYLQQQRPQKRLAIFWDNATCHRSQNFRICTLIKFVLPIVGCPGSSHGKFGCDQDRDYPMPTGGGYAIALCRTHLNLETRELTTQDCKTDY